MGYYNTQTTRQERLARLSEQYGLPSMAITVAGKVGRELRYGIATIEAGPDGEVQQTPLLEGVRGLEIDAFLDGMAAVLKLKVA